MPVSSENTEHTICNHAGYQTVIKGKCSANIDKDKSRLVFCDANGTEISTPDIFTVSAPAVDESSPTEMAVTITMNNAVQAGGEYYVKMIANNGYESLPVKLIVIEPNYTLDFSGEANQWVYKGTAFGGTDANTTSTYFDWYGTAADGFDAKTLVLKDFQFTTTAVTAVRLPADTTVILKGDSNYIKGQNIAMSFNGTGGKIISGQTEKPTLTLISAEPYESCFAALYSDAALEISDCIINATAEDYIVYTDNTKAAIRCYAVVAGSLTLNNTELTASSGTLKAMAGGVDSEIESRAIIIDGTLTIKGSSTIKAKSYGGAPIRATTLTSAKATEFTNGKLSLEQYNTITGNAILEQADAEEPLVIKTSGLHFTEAVLKTDDAIEKGAEFTFDINSHIDGGKAPYNYTLSNPPSWMNLENGIITGTPTVEASATTANITVTDEMGDSIKGSFTIGAVVPFYEVEVICGANGTVTAEPTQEKYAKGSDVVLTVTPDSEYRVKTAKLNGNGVTLTADNKYTIENISAANSFNVEFEKMPYTITVNSNEGGTVTPTTEVFEGESFTLTVSANTGYRVKSVMLDGTDVTLTKNKYTIESIDKNHTFTVTFEPIPKYTITVNSNEGGTVTPTTEVFEGESFTLTVSANTAYRVKSVMLDGTDVTLTKNKYTIESIDKNYTFTVTFEPIPKYTITVNSNEGGTVTPTTEVYEGESFTLTVSANTGYRVKSVMFDGAGVALIDGTGTIVNISKNHTFTVEFEKLKYTVIVDCGENGRVSPETTTVEYGDNLTLTVSASTGYKVSSVKLDGTSVTLANGKYTIKNITSNHTFAVAFSKKTSGGNDGGGSGGYTPSVTVENEPTIKDKNEIEGWDKINDVIKSTKIGGTVEISMNDTTLLPKDTIELIKGKNINLVLYIENDYSWTINGTDVTAAKSLYLGINPNPDTSGVKTANAELLNLNGIKYLSIESNGNFGLTATLSVPLGKEYAYKKASVFICGKPDFLTGCTIAADGTASLKLSSSALLEIRIDSITYMPNDATNDFTVNMQDALAVLKYSIGSESFADKKLELMDANNDGAANIKDALAIMKMSLA